MLPHPAAVNQEDRSYIILGHDGLQVRVTEGNWDTLRFNTKTLNPEFFPASYLRPVPTGLHLENPEVNKTFPRSTITGTLAELRQLLKVSLLSKSKRISPEVYKALCLEGASGAVSAADELTASKRIKVFIKLCSVFIPCEIHVDKQLPFVAKRGIIYARHVVRITCYLMLYFLGLYEIPKMFQG